MESQSGGNRRISLRPHVIVVTLSICIAPAAYGQWPTHYTQPRIIETGTDVRAGSVLASDDGGVFVSYESDDAVNRLKLSKYDAGGNLVIEGRPRDDDRRIAKTVILPPLSPARLCNLATLYIPRDLDSDFYAFRYQDINLYGQWDSSSTPARQMFEAALPNNNGAHQFACYNPWGGIVNAMQTTSPGTDQIHLEGSRAKDFTIIMTRPDESLVAFSKHGRFEETPAEVWLYPFVGTPFPPATGAPVQAQVQPGESQVKPKLTNVYLNQHLLTWIGKIRDQSRLYAKIVNDNGNEIVAGRIVLNDVSEYTAIPSTLGVSVMAGVQKVPGMPHTLFAGLLDGHNGIALTLPMVTADGVRLKDLRQEADGNFSLTYSIPENGTTLLKVRRISGTTGGTLWETTVADLGMPTDDILKRYPNTFVTGTAHGVLYILSRNDTPGSNVSSFALARLRPDGQLGADPLAAPTSLTAAHVGLGNIGLTWDDNTTAETNYIVGRSLTDFSGVEILATLPANTTTYTDTTAARNTTYRYYVAAYQSDSGNYLVSDEIQITTPNVLIEI